MAAPLNSSSRLQSMLQAAVQSVQWTYTIFWQFCPQQGILKWGDGYYNGAIKTRKTVQGTTMEEGIISRGEGASLERSQQLRELYELLSGGETSMRQSRRPYCATALSPEDLTESEWFYLICVSFSFHPGVELPGTAYARRQHLWLTGAHKVDTQTFSRAILAKSANIQTVVCIPLMEGVVEFGTTDKVKEDLDFIEHVKSFFKDHHPPPKPEPVLSEHSTSNLTSSYPAIATANVPNHIYDLTTEVKEEAKLVSQAEIVLDNSFPSIGEIMDPYMLDDIRIGSPGDGSDHLDSYPEESTQMWPGPVEEPVPLEMQLHQQPTSDKLLPVDSSNIQVPVPSEDMAQCDDTHYSQTVSTILQNVSVWWLPESPSVSHLSYPFESAFTMGSPGADHHRLHDASAVNSQWLLKYILFSVPYLHHTNNNNPQTPRAKGAPPQQEASGGHVLAERRRREKLKERFVILRSLLPFVTKTDKASVLGDAIEYVKELRVKFHELEARNRRMEEDRRRRGAKRKRRGDRPVLEVSTIEDEVLVLVECMHREGLLVDVMRTLRELGVEVTVVQSSVKDDGVFVAELRAKVKENAKNGKQGSIVEVKKALNRIIQHEHPHHHHQPYAVAPAIS